MPYYNVTAHTLYQSCLTSPWGSSSNAADPLYQAEAWIRAVNIYEYFQVVQKWFEYLQAGTYIHQYPEPFWEDIEGKAPLTQDAANNLIYKIDEDFMMEKTRFQGRKAPEFARLPPAQRLAMAQEVWAVTKTMGQIKEEARKRLEAGEKMPPPIEAK